MSEAFSFSIASIEAERELKEQQKRTKQVEAELRRMQKSKWWRMTSPLRKTVGKKLEQTPKRAEAKALEAKSEVEARQAALLRRISTVLDEYAAPSPDATSLDASLEALGALLDAHSHDKPLAWLSFIAIVSQYPTSEDMVRFSTDVIVNGAPAAIAQLLKKNAELPRSWALSAGLELVRDVAVDPTSTSHREFHSGIQRVVRETVPRWFRDHPVRLMIWGAKGGAYRDPNTSERWRIMEFEPRVRDVPGLGEVFTPDDIFVPWKTTVVVPEPSTQEDRSAALSCLGTWSGNQLAAVFYDFIVYTLPDTLTDKSRIGLSNFIPVIRSAHRVSTISATVGREVESFAALVENTGLRGPQAAAQLLPVNAITVPEAERATIEQRLTGVPGLPLVVSVSSVEPRKNQLMALRAAEKLWNEGLAFQMAFVGWGSWRAEAFFEEVDRAQQKGRPVRIIRQVDEPTLWTAYTAATFTMYISIAEGYGLPAAESIAAGTPVVLSNQGSMAEIGVGGGALMVDPRNVDEVAAAMRTLLTDDDALATLRAEAQQRPQSSWDDYADATWRWLVDGES